MCAKSAWIASVVIALVGWTADAGAQYPSELVSFEGTPSGNPANQEMFREPGWSTTTSNYVVANSAPGVFDRNAAFRNPNVNFATDGSQALEVLWKWQAQDDPDAWVRLTTFNGAERPNPALDLRGKVRFDLTNFGDFTGGEIGVCLGIRETGVDVAQLANGGSSGTIEWVGVDPAVNAIIAGSNGIAETLAIGDDVQAIPVGSNGLGPQAVVVLPGANQVIDSVAGGDDVARFGYYIGTNGIRVPIPAVTVPISFAVYAIEFDLSTGDVTVDDGFGPITTPGAIAGFTGDGILDAADDRGTLEHLAVTNVTTDPPTSSSPVVSDVYFGIDRLQFEATVADPVPPPRVVAPLIAGDTSVTVTDLVATVDRVTLLVNGSPLPPQDVASNADVTFSIAPAVTGDVYTATQRDGVTGLTSVESPGVTVFAEPSPFTFSILLDESGSGSCSFASPGWEWVGVTSFATAQSGTKWVPQGQPVFRDDAAWQQVDVPLDNPNLIIASLGGNGALAPSPTGYYNIDSAWLTIASGADSNGLGPWEVFLDRVQAVGPGGATTLMSMEDGINRFGPSRGQAVTPTTSSDVSALAGYDGVSSHRIEWTYTSIDPSEAVGKLQRTTGCGTAADIPDDSTAIRFHLLIRGPAQNPGVPLPAVVGPIVGDQSTVRILNDPGATAVQLYVNGGAVGPAVAPSGTQTDFVGLSLQAGDSVSATQTLGAGASDFAYPRAVTAEPLPPTIAGILVAGATDVTIADVLTAPFASATAVTIFQDGVEIGSVTSSGFASASVVAPVSALTAGSLVTATQMVNGAESAESAAVLVAATSRVTEYEFAPTLIGLSRAISSADLIAGQVGTLENGDVDLANGVVAWNMDSGSGCLGMLDTQPSPGFHPATPPGGLADLTDGVAGSTLEAVLADFNRAALVVRYDFPEPITVDEIVVFAANEDPNAPNNGRLYQTYDVYVSTNGMASFAPLMLAVTTGPFGQINVSNDRATFTHVYDALGQALARRVTNLRFVFYDVSNTAGRFQDPWQGIANEDAGYQAACPLVEPEDVDGFRKAFEAPIIKEIDVFGRIAGDGDGDGDVDLVDYAAFAECLAGPAAAPDPAAPLTAAQCLESFDFDGDGDVDLEDAEAFARAFTG